MVPDDPQPAKRPPRLILEVLTSSLAGRRFGYTSDELRRGVLVGRGHDCNLRFDTNRDLKVSNHHALITETAEGCVLRDRGSVNGVYVNGQRVLPEGRPLADGDEIHLGQEGAVLRVSMAGVPQPAPPAAPPASLPPATVRDANTLARLVNEVGDRHGAGSKTRHMLMAVAESIEARQARKRRRAMLIGLAMFALLALAGAIVTLVLISNEDEAEARDRKDRARNEQLESERRRELESVRGQLAELQAAMARQEATTAGLRAEQERRLEQLKHEVGEATAARVREISEAQFKTLREATEEQVRTLQTFHADTSFRELVDRYNASVFLVFVQYPLLNEQGEAVGVESSTGTGWIARVSDDRAWVVTNKHVIKPFLFNAELAITHAIRGVRPAPESEWTIACWQPGAKIRDQIGDTRLNLSQAWAHVPGGSGGNGRVRVAGYAPDDAAPIGDRSVELLAQFGFRPDLPADMLARIRGAVIHADSAADLALLEFERRDPGSLTTALPIASDAELHELHQMERVLSLGYPLGLSIIKGTTVTSSPATGEIRSLQFEVGKLHTSAPTLPGNSGGPLIDGRGRVIGVITRRYEATTGEAISAAHARELVDRLAR